MHKQSVISGSELVCGKNVDRTKYWKTVTKEESFSFLCLLCLSFSDNTVFLKGNKIEQELSGGQTRIRWELIYTYILKEMKAELFPHPIQKRKLSCFMCHGKKAQLKPSIK